MDRWGWIVMHVSGLLHMGYKVGGGGYVECPA